MVAKDAVENPEQNIENTNEQKQQGGVEKLQPDKKKTPRVHIATFRGIPLKLHESLKAIAESFGISPGELARYFLEDGLSRVGAGEENIAPSFVPGGYTLYPEEKKAAAVRPRRKRSKISQQPRSYYGVPREVVESVLVKSKSMGITQGELARYLFERGVARFKAGELVLEPVPVQQIATLYPEDLGKA